MKTKFLLKNPKEGKNTIYIRVRIGRSIDIFLATKETVSIDDWDNSTGLLLEEYIDYKSGKLYIRRDKETKVKIEENKTVNYRLIELKKAVEDSYKTTTEKIDREWLKNIVYPTYDKVDATEISFLQYCDVFLESKGSSISKHYKTKVKSIKAIVERYLRLKRFKNLLTNEIDVNFKNDFEKYCIEIEKYSVNYFERNFKFIKTILYHAKLNGYPINDSLSNVKCKTEKPMFVILNSKELEIIENKTFSEEHLETAKDWLLISCFSGQRISDFMRFNTDMIIEKSIIINGDKGFRNKFFIEFVQEKTNKQIFLPLSEKIIDILKKRDWSFPRKMSEARYNEHIKKVCELVGINELIEGTLAIKQEDENIKNRKKNNRRKTKGLFPKYQLVSSHIGRRSFASNNFGKIPTPLIMVATGHSSPNMLMKYIGKIDEQQSLALAEYI